MHRRLARILMLSQDSALDHRNNRLAQYPLVAADNRIRRVTSGHGAGPFQQLMTQGLQRELPHVPVTPPIRSEAVTASKEQPSWPPAHFAHRAQLTFRAEGQALPQLAPRRLQNRIEHPGTWLPSSGGGPAPLAFG
jgi:hypothetical protein